MSVTNIATVVINANGATVNENTSHSPNARIARRTVQSPESGSHYNRASADLSVPAGSAGRAGTDGRAGRAVAESARIDSSRPRRRARPPKARRIVDGGHIRG